MGATSRPSGIVGCPRSDGERGGRPGGRLCEPTEHVKRTRSSRTLHNIGRSRQPRHGGWAGLRTTAPRRRPSSNSTSTPTTASNYCSSAPYRRLSNNSVTLIRQPAATSSLFPPISPKTPPSYKPTLTLFQSDYSLPYLPCPTSTDLNPTTAARRPSGAPRFAIQRRRSPRRPSFQIVSASSRFPSPFLSRLCPVVSVRTGHSAETPATNGS